MTRLRQIALAGAATLVALLLVEGAARWLGINPGYGRFISLGEAPTRDVGGVTLWQDHDPRASGDGAGQGRTEVVRANHPSSGTAAR